MRAGRAARTDGNQQAVVRSLRDAGVLVRSLATVGDGMPDLLCAYRGLLVLLEVKDGDKPPSARTLTAAELEFVATWPHTYVVTSPAEAVRVVVEAARPRGPEVVVPRCKCGEAYLLEVSCPKCDTPPNDEPAAAVARG